MWSDKLQLENDVDGHFSVGKTSRLGNELMIIIIDDDEMNENGKWGR